MATRRNHAARGATLDGPEIRDSDAEGTRENLLQMIALKERLPELIIVPGHDMRAFAEMPTLSPASSEAARPAMETKKQ